VLGIEPATVRYLAVRLARHAPRVLRGLTAEALVDKLIERGIPQTRHLSVWAIDPALVREALNRREATSIPARVYPEHASNGQSMVGSCQGPGSAEARACAQRPRPVL